MKIHRAGQAMTDDENTKKRLGDFEIIRELGRGGMGIVFEARQASLNRKVALKVISGSLGLSSKAVLRFQREAEAAGKLHHTNIVPIYSTGSDDGTHYYAMELIDGPSLHQVIQSLRRGETSNASTVAVAEEPSVSAIDAALDWLDSSSGAVETPDWVSEILGSPPLSGDATPVPKSSAGMSSTSQPASSSYSSTIYFDTVARMIAGVADGLDYAHGNGVIHRDIKPANLLLSKDGRVSINDFGLARMLEQPGMTISGEFVGSPLYMSPEQITAGRAPLNHRTDIYSLGATLYELLTLQSPFPGQSRDAVIAQIIHKEPVPPRRQNPKVPLDLETICLKAMEKDPDRRYQTAGLMAEDLRRFVDRFAIHARRVSLARRAAKFVQRHRVAAAATVGVFLAAAIASGLVWRYWPEPRLALTLPQQLTRDLGLTTEPTLSSAGSHLAYASDRAGEGNLDIWIHELDAGGSTLEPRRLTSHAADDHEPALSRDGKRLAFRSERDGGGIYTLSTAGEERNEVLLARLGRRPRFSPDGRLIAYWAGHIGGSVSGALYVVSARGGEPTRLEAEFVAARTPIWLPDGRRLLFLGRESGGAGNEFNPSDDWWVTPIDGGRAVRTEAFTAFKAPDIRRGLSNAGPVPGAWSARGDRVFFLGRVGRSFNLWAVALDRETGSPLAAPWVLMNTTGRYGDPALDARGRVVFASETENVDLWSLRLVDGEADGAPEQITEQPGFDFDPSLSPDGERLFYTSDRAGSLGVWVKNLRTKVLAPLADDPSQDEYSPSVDSAGSQVAFDKEGELHVIDAGGGASRFVARADGIFGWSTDGKNGLLADGWLINVATGEKTQVLEESAPLKKWQLYFSPDGRWISFNAEDGVHSKVVIAPYRPGEITRRDKWIRVSSEKSWDDVPRWSTDGKILYYTSERDGFRCIWGRRLTDAKQPDGEPFAVYHAHNTRLSLMNVRLGTLSMSVAADKIVFTQGERTGNIWAAELKEEY